MRRWLMGCVAGLWLALMVAPAVWARPLSSVQWNRYDVDIQIRTDGTLLVTEVQTIQFGGGQSYRKGFAVIPQARGSIGDVKVWEGNQAYSFSYSNEPYTYETSTNDNGDIEIVWYFPPTVNTAHTFNLQYTVRDGILYYPDRQYDRVQWIAVPYDLDYPVAAAQVTVHTPAGAPILRAGAANVSPAVYSISPDQLTATFQSTRPLQPGEGLEVRVDFQHGVVAGSAPSWQFKYDLQEQYKPLIDLASLGLAALIAIGGTLLIVLRWYTKGRDPQVGLAAEYVAEPPGNLPPGVAGTLLDERADMQDIIATLIDLARRGYVSMEELQTPGFLGIGASRDFIFRREAAPSRDTLRPYERLVLDRVIPGNERRLSDLKDKFYQHVSEIQSELYKEVVVEGLFPRRPDTVRSQWGCAGTGLIILAVGGAIGASALLGDITGWVVLPFVALGFVGVVTAASLNAMPVKTRQGAEAAAQWRAFKRYLSNLDRYTKVQEAADQFEKYLPYAIAFGLERSWINRFARVDTVPMPMWYRPYGWGPAYHGGGGSMSGSSGGGLGQAPSVQGMSNGLARSLGSMSAGLTTMLNSAASTFSSVPQSKGGGGGWGGGGFSGGGGGGGGSRGFG